VSAHGLDRSVTGRPRPWCRSLPGSTSASSGFLRGWGIDRARSAMRARVDALGMVDPVIGQMGQVEEAPAMVGEGERDLPGGADEQGDVAQSGEIVFVEGEDVHRLLVKRSRHPTPLAGLRGGGVESSRYYRTPSARVHCSAQGPPFIPWALQWTLAEGVL